MTTHLLGTIGIYISAVLATIGFAAFVLMARFWRSRGGWFVFWDLLLITWVLDLSSISHIWDPPWFAWTRAATFAVGFPVVLAWRCWVIFDLQLIHRSTRGGAYGKPDTASEETHGA